MLRIGLTGSRYSGKDTIGKLFRQIKVPVFNADVVLKFILKYEFHIIDEITDNIGQEYYKNGGFDSDEILKDNKFNDILKVVKPYIFKKYSEFEKKHVGSVYTIFHSSLLFESEWYKEMDLTINVSAPFDERLKRGFLVNGIKCDYDKFDLENLLKKEKDHSFKNKLSDIIIQNYGIFDVLDQVNKADTKIVNFYLKSKMTKSDKDYIF
jgi:dephospho-CoA kinase